MTRAPGRERVATKDIHQQAHTVVDVVAQPRKFPPPPPSITASPTRFGLSNQSELILALSALGVATEACSLRERHAGLGASEELDKAWNFFGVDLYNSSDTGSTRKS